MLAFLDRNRKWLTVAFVFLLLLEIVTFPYVVGASFADRSEDPNHTLTYTTNQLAWTTTEGINDQGAAIFGIFDPQYANVASENGDYVVAPGTESGTFIRLFNQSSREITFRAVMYMTQLPQDLPVYGAMDGENLTDEALPALPEGVTQQQVVRAVTGKVGPKNKQDFDLTWSWDFYESDARDVYDTYLGDASAAGDPGTVSIGFYLVAEEDGETVIPGTPVTGDGLGPWLYVGLMVLSVLVVAFLVLEGIWERKRQC